MATANPDAEVPQRRLQLKYADLCRKYAALVRRLERRNERHSAVFQLGLWGLQVRGVGLAMVRADKIVLANARFAEMGKRAPGRWVRHGSHESYPDLRGVVLEQARRMSPLARRTDEALFHNEALDRYVSVHGQPGGRGSRGFVSVLLEDVTEDARRDHELLRTREALLQRERLRVLGELAAAIAHDLGNTLRGASFEIAALDSRGDGMLSGVARRVEVASEIVTRLHDFARAGSMKSSAVRIGEIIGQAAALAEIELRGERHPIRVVRSIPDLPPVRGSAPELTLLFVNLLRNARDAMPGGGTVTISAEHLSGMVSIRVKDQGTGIAADVLPRLFQPFFTTKGTLGTGLGLWLAKGTMERLGGSIRAENQSGGGAIFSLTFPVADSVSRGPGEKRPVPARRARSSPGLRRPPPARHGARKT